MRDTFSWLIMKLHSQSSKYNPRCGAKAGMATRKTILDIMLIPMTRQMLLFESWCWQMIFQHFLHSPCRYGQTTSPRKHHRQKNPRVASDMFNGADAECLEGIKAAGCFHLPWIIALFYTSGAANILNGICPRLKPPYILNRHTILMASPQSAPSVVVSCLLV